VRFRQSEAKISKRCKIATGIAKMPRRG